MLSKREECEIIAMVCSDPPQGRALWSVRLITKEVVARKIAPRVGRETIRLMLASHDLKPWRKKMWCVPKLNEEYVRRMEDLLSLYEKPYDAKEPVVCLDERPVQLLDDVRPTSAIKPGQVVKQDYEYRRCGTANVFCGVEPLAGRHFTKVTPNRKGPEYAEMV